jgi:hypothetical protein
VCLKFGLHFQSEGRATQRNVPASQRPPRGVGGDADVLPQRMQALEVTPHGDGNYYPLIIPVIF